MAVLPDSVIEAWENRENPENNIIIIADPNHNAFMDVADTLYPIGGDPNDPNSNRGFILLAALTAETLPGSGITLIAVAYASAEDGNVYAREIEGTFDFDESTFAPEDGYAEPQFGTPLIVLIDGVVYHPTISGTNAEGYYVLENLNLAPGASLPTEAIYGYIIEENADTRFSPAMKVMSMITPLEG